MSDKETGGPAFPRPAVFTAAHGLASVEQDGMTLRDWFAGFAMQGLLAADTEFSMGAGTVSNLAYEYADAMLEARK